MGLLGHARYFISTCYTDLCKVAITVVTGDTIAEELHAEPAFASRVQYRTWLSSCSDGEQKWPNWL